IPRGMAGRRGRRPLPMKCFRTLFPHSNGFVIKKLEAIYSNDRFLIILLEIKRIMKQEENISMKTRSNGIMRINKTRYSNVKNIGFVLFICVFCCKVSLPTFFP
ncbi:MAG: hypothetical protein IKU45_06955, partial [Clostridia bacterium]|nr:hypothetical protein [Clostridia bacterium]